MKEELIYFQKISLRELIDTLIILYDGGANYVDIIGKNGDVQDNIGFAVRDEYMASPEEMEEVDDDDDDFWNEEDGNDDELLSNNIEKPINPPSEDFLNNLMQ